MHVFMYHAHNAHNEWAVDMNMTFGQFATRLSTIQHESTQIDPVDLADVVIYIDGQLIHIEKAFVVMNRMNDETATCVLVPSDDTYDEEPGDHTMANIMYRLQDD